jgi:aspartate kinase
MIHGYLTRVFEVFDKHQTSIDLIATSEVTISITTDRVDTIKAIEADLSEYGDVTVQSDVAIVTIVGRKFKETTGLAGKIFDTLKNINILMISAGASDINMSFVCSSEDADLAVQQLHETFFARVVSK